MADPVDDPRCTCPYFAGDDDECTLHGEQARYDEWRARKCDHCPHPKHDGMCGKTIETNTFCGCFGRPRGDNDMRAP